MKAEDGGGVYEPAEDTWALVDAMQADLSEDAWRGAMPRVCVEVGCGSGFVTNALADAVAARWGEGGCLCFATDINMHAAKATQALLQRRRLVEVVACDLVQPMVQRLQHSVDILVFNPPYVPTCTAELARATAERGLAASWAGGPQGTAVLDRLLPLVPQLLAVPRGRFYLVAVTDNAPRAISERLLALGLAPKLLLTRTAGPEHLLIIRFTWRAPPKISPSAV